jgi:23S rRNA (uracil1939-C5)-methyltransferase
MSASVAIVSTHRRRKNEPPAVDQSKPTSVSLACPHRPPCPGCPRFGEPGIALAANGALENLSNACGIADVPVISGALTGFRHRARLAIRGRLNSPKVGLFELGSHRVVHIPDCRVQHPLINRVATIVRRALVDARVTSYSDAAGLGLARYLQVVVERRSQTAQVVIVANSPTPEPLAVYLDLIAERLGSELHSLWFNANCDQSNTILGPQFVNWCGPASVVEHFGGAAVHYPPGAFGQSNLEIAGAIIEYLRARIPEGARVAEFYAGVGAIGLSLLDRVGEISFNEVSPHSLQGLELGLSQLDAAARAKIILVPGSAGAARLAASGVEVVIVDPPRKGLDPEFTQFLSEEPPAHLLYVSCAPDSLAHDTAKLTAHGKLRLTTLTAFNLFPFTEHVETVACFERNDRSCLTACPDPSSMTGPPARP